MGVTKIRWAYDQPLTTAATGNYVIGIYDASGRTIVDTGAVAFTGAIGVNSHRAEMIAATTFEAGAYDLLAGMGVGNGFRTITTRLRVDTNGRAPYPNIALCNASGGTTTPATLLSFVTLAPRIRRCFRSSRRVRSRSARSGRWRSASGSDETRRAGHGPARPGSFSVRGIWVLRNPSGDRTADPATVAVAEPLRLAGVFIGLRHG